MTSMTTNKENSAVAASGKRKSLDLERFALIGVWIVLIIFFSILLPQTFPTAANVSNMLGSQAVLLILALGLLIPMRAGVYDLSVASAMNFSAVIVAVGNVQWGLSIWVAVLLGIIAASLVGVVNGFIVTKFGIDPFIVTLGIGTVVVGLTYWVSNARTTVGVDRELSNFVLAKPFLAIPVDVYYALGLCFIVWYLFQYTAFGQRLLFVGQNPEVARLNGVPVGRLRWTSLIASAFVAGIAGAVFVGTTGSADPTAGQAFLLPAFAAVFLGSTVLTIGRFNAWGTVIAVYFLATGITGLQLLGLQQFVQQLFYGGALVIAVVLSKLVRSRSEKQAGAA
jgi:ribose transport system permease protein